MVVGPTPIEESELKQMLDDFDRTEEECFLVKDERAKLVEEIKQIQARLAEARSHERFLSPGRIVAPGSESHAMTNTPIPLDLTDEERDVLETIARLRAAGTKSKKTGG